MSPASLCYGDFDSMAPPSAAPSDGFSPSQHSPTASMHPAFPWLSRPTSMDFGGSQQHQQQHAHHPQQQAQQPGGYLDMHLLNQGLLEPSFGTIKPHVLSCPNPDVMMGISDPMIYSGYDPDPLRM